MHLLGTGSGRRWAALPALLLLAAALMSVRLHRVHAQSPSQLTLSGISRALASAAAGSIGVPMLFLNVSASSVTATDTDTGLDALHL